MQEGLTLGFLFFSIVFLSYVVYDKSRTWILKQKRGKNSTKVDVKK